MKFKENLNKELKKNVETSYENGVLSCGKWQIDVSSDQQDDFAIGFARWLTWRKNEIITKELLEIYKKEKEF
jgi:hypothetical protein